MIHNSIKILSVGDTVLKTRFNTNPFAKIYQIFENYNYVIINLETVIISKKNIFDYTLKSVLLFTYEEDLDWLQYYKEKLIFTLANNHIYDFGIDGYNNTISFLKKNNIMFVPPDSSLILSEFEPKIRIDAVCDRIKNSHSIKILDFEDRWSDDNINILCIHWGNENVMIPSLKQVDMANEFFKKGVDVIIGHHSHTPQGRLVSGSKVCAFSLGNFNMLHVTGVPREMERTGLMLELDITNDGTTNITNRLMPVYLDDNFTPTLLYGHRKHGDLVNKLDSLLPKLENQSRVKYLLSYQSHVARNYIVDNMRHGWIPRIKKYGINHFIQMLRWFISRRFLISLLFLPFNRFSRATKLMNEIND